MTAPTDTEEVPADAGTPPARRGLPGDVPPRGPRLGPLGWLRWGWRQLTSMRVALWLLGLLALAAVPGSLLPQRGADPAAVLAYFRDHPGRAPMLDRLYLFDVYGSPWFEAVYLLLFISLLGCVLPRAKRHLLALRARPAFPPARMSGHPGFRSWRTPASPDSVLESARSLLRRDRYRLDRHPTAVAAEKGFLRELGNLAFHLALLLILVAVAIGHRGGYRANVAVPEGKGFANSPVQFDTYTAGSGVRDGSLTPFSLTLDQLDVRYEQGGSQLGQSRDFFAHVRWRPSPGEPLREDTISPNRPLVVDGTKVFLLGQGYAPRFTVRDGQGNVVSSGPVVLLPRAGDVNLTSTGAVKAPDALPEQLGFNVTFLPTALRVVRPDGSGTDPISVFPDARSPRVFVTGAFRGDLGLDDGRSQSVYQLDTSRMSFVRAKDRDGVERPATAELAPGDTMTLPNGSGSITFDGTARFASFAIAGDPGRGPALAAGILALLGLMTSLYLRPRRLWVRATRSDDGHTVVEVAAWSHLPDERLDAETQRLAERLHEVAPVSEQPAETTNDVRTDDPTGVP